MGDIKDESMIGRLDEIKYKSPVESKQKLTGLKIFEMKKQI